LPGHLEDVIQAAKALLDGGDGKFLHAMGLPAGEFPREHLQRAVLLAAWLHDVGKANHQFQRAVRSSGPFSQAVRHEWVSAWLPMAVPELDRWLFAGCPTTVRWVVIFAALGHHLKAGDADALQPRAGSGDTDVSVFMDHPDVTHSLRWVSEDLSLGTPPELPCIRIDLIHEPLADLRRELIEGVLWFDSATSPTRRFLALVKALVTAADVAGSVVPRRESDIAKWTRDVLGRTCSGNDLAQIATTALDGRKPRPFQQQLAGAENGVALVRAGCGTGKTVGAYLWAARHAQGRKLFFCYPTTGTATEGFRDYVLPDLGDVQGRLLHSRSEVDLEELLVAEDSDPMEYPIRFDSLAAWDVPVVVCTTDRVLGLIQNNRPALFSSPAICNGAFVFDEIHQYDDRLFSALLRFVEAFPKAPKLLMTASLQRARLDALREVIGSQEFNVIDGPQEVEAIQRYQLHGPVKAPPWEEVERTLSDGGRVLWVANTVDRAATFAQEAASRGLAPLLLYHSRYRYTDRVAHHRAVIDTFNSEEPVLAITTQVCEVSLNISADLLVTELAPVPSLIQRLGRLNRHVDVGQEVKPASAVFLEPQNRFPYGKREVADARPWLEALRGRLVSQIDLATQFEDGAEAMQFSRQAFSSWLDGGPFTDQAPLRDLGVTAALLLSGDAAQCVDGKGRVLLKEVARYSIPMPVTKVMKEIRAWRRIGYAFVAPEGRITYSHQWGARWAT